MTTTSSHQIVVTVTLSAFEAAKSAASAILANSDCAVLERDASILGCAQQALRDIVERDFTALRHLGRDGLLASVLGLTEDDFATAAAQEAANLPTVPVVVPRLVIEWHTRLLSPSPATPDASLVLSGDDLVF